MSNNSRKKNRDKHSQAGNPMPKKQPVSNDDYLCVRGPVYGPSGYANITRNIFEGLHRAGKRIWLEALSWAVQPTMEYTSEFEKTVRSHPTYPPEQPIIDKTTGLLCICTPPDFKNQQIGPNTWNYTIFETTQIPQEWLQILSSPSHQRRDVPAIKGLILPTKANANVSFHQAPQKKVVVPLAIDYDVYCPDGDRRDLKWKSDFNILISYHHSIRKNPEFVIRVINELDENTTVYLKTFMQGMSSIEQKKIAQAFREEIKGRCRVVLLYDIISDREQAKLYRSMDLILNLSHGEGWDLPRVEAYSCGTPALGPMFMAPEEYTIPEFRLISQKIVNCPDHPPYFHSGAQWAELDLIDVLYAIDKIRKSPEEYRNHALKQREALIKHTGTLEQMGGKIWETVMG